MDYKTMVIASRNGVSKEITEFSSASGRLNLVAARISRFIKSSVTEYQDVLAKVFESLATVNDEGNLVIPEDQLDKRDQFSEEQEKLASMKVTIPSKINMTEELVEEMAQHVSIPVTEFLLEFIDGE